MHPGREHEDELTVFESLGIAVEDLASASSWCAARVSAAWASRSTSDPARGHRGRSRADRRHGDPHAARPPPRGRRAGGDLAEAREPPADRLLQAARRGECRAQRAAGGARPGARHDEHREHGAGRRLDGPRAGCPRDDRRSRQRIGRKLAAVERLGGRIVRVPWEQWWAAVEADEERNLGSDVEGFFVHPVRDPPVMAGNGTIGLELVEQLQDIDAVLIPWGGGGLTTGIGSALHALHADTKVYVCEPQTARRSPLRSRTAASLSRSSSRRCLWTAPVRAPAAEMWEHAKPLVNDSFAISLEDTAKRCACCSNGRASWPRAPLRCLLLRLAGVEARRPRRLHRLRREHRRGPPRRDPRRPRARLVDERALEPCERLRSRPRDRRHSRKGRAARREESEHACAQAARRRSDRTQRRTSRARPVGAGSRRRADRWRDLRRRRRPSRSQRVRMTVDEDAERADLRGRERPAPATALLRIEQQPRPRDPRSPHPAPSSSTSCSRTRTTRKPCPHVRWDPRAARPSDLRPRRHVVQLAEEPAELGSQDHYAGPEPASARSDPGRSRDAKNGHGNSRSAGR